MKRGYWIPLGILGTILTLALWNDKEISGRADRWQTQLQYAQQSAREEDWHNASAALEDSYADWSACQVWLHIVAEHDVIDDAEAMYQRAAAFAATEEPSEFQAEMADLLSQIRLLAETERLRLENIL